MTGLRERQKVKRRRDILDAAARLFKRDGFAAASIDEIAANATLSAGTVYNYFPSKGDLLLALVALDGQEVRAAGAAIVEAPPADPVKAVCRLLEVYVDHALVHLDKRLWRQMMANALAFADTPLGAGYRELDRKLAEQVADLCRALQGRGRLARGIDCGDAGQILFFICNSRFMEFVADDAMSRAKMKERMFRQVRLALAGMST
jgi:AcrR family transcriptional regulator